MFEDVFSKKGLSLERLRRFCEVARAGSIAQAEQTNGRNQSSYSRDIIALEAYFGFRLFGRAIGHNRSGTRMNTLTPQGRALLATTMEMFRHFEDFRDFSDVPKRIRIAGGETVLHWVIGTHMPAIISALPRTTVDLEEVQTQEESLTALKEGRVDFAIVEESAAAAATFPQRVLPLGSLEFSLYVHQESLANTRRSAHARILGKIPLIALRDTSHTAAEAVADMERGGVKIHLAATLSSFRQATTALRGRRLAAVLPTLAKAEMSRMGFQPLEISTLQHLSVDISLIYNEEQQAMRPYLHAVAETLSRVMVPLDGGDQIRHSSSPEERGRGVT